MLPATPARLDSVVPLTPMTDMSPNAAASMMEGGAAIGTRSRRHAASEMNAADALHVLSSPIPALASPAGSTRRTARRAPVETKNLNTLVSLSAGSYHTCGILANTSIVCWGKNSEGQIGNGGSADSDVLSRIDGYG